MKTKQLFAQFQYLALAALFFVAGCATPQNTLVDPNQAVTAYIALDNLDANVDSLEVIVKPNTDFVAKVPNANLTRAFTVKTKSRVRLLSVNGQAAEEMPVLELKDMLPSTYSTSISSVDNETGVVLFESNSSLEVKPQPARAVSPAACEYRE
jgi:hypothetical protein